MQVFLLIDQKFRPLHFNTSRDSIVVCSFKAVLRENGQVGG